MRTLQTPSGYGSGNEHRRGFCFSTSSLHKFLKLQYKLYSNVLLFTEVAVLSDASYKRLFVYFMPVHL